MCALTQLCRLPEVCLGPREDLTGERGFARTDGLNDQTHPLMLRLTGDGASSCTFVLVPWEVSAVLEFGACWVLLEYSIPESMSKGGCALGNPRSHPTNHAELQCSNQSLPLIVPALNPGPLHLAAGFV